MHPQSANGFSHRRQHRSCRHQRVRSRSTAWEPAIKSPTTFAEVGLPEGTENLGQMKSMDLSDKFIKATAMLQDQLEQLLEECRPHFLVADMLFPWATDAAAKFSIPRLFFYGSSTFATSAQESLSRHRPHDNASSDSEPFVVPNLPHEIKKLNSVVYICFGSLCSFTVAQLHEIANGLEASGQDFIWVVRDCFDEEDNKKWFPQGFEERTKRKGLIVKGWAPQLLILGHAAVGAFEMETRETIILIPFEIR